MLLAAARRVVLLVAGVMAATAASSVLIGLVAGSRPTRAMSVGFYSVGALFLVGCFIMGVRGPLRPEFHDRQRGGLFGARGVRRTTPEERAEAGRTALFLFAVGFGLIVLGAVLDPIHRLS